MCKRSARPNREVCEEIDMQSMHVCRVGADEWCACARVRSAHVCWSRSATPYKE